MDKSSLVPSFKKEQSFLLQTPTHRQKFLPFGAARRGG
jgi:hypothetical protein